MIQNAFIGVNHKKRGVLCYPTKLLQGEGPNSVDHEESNKKVNQLMP